jgi:hypothetical protein
VFIILVVVMVSQVDAYVNIIRTYTLIMCNLLYANYASMKLFKENQVTNVCGHEFRHV